MKKIVLILALAMTSALHAKDLKNCVLMKDNKVVKGIDAFDILNVETNEPEATIDGGLLDYSETETEVSMSFSNECDNEYDMTFKKADLAKDSGKISGPARISLAGWAEDGGDIDEEGTLTCEISK